MGRIPSLALGLGVSLAVLLGSPALAGEPTMLQEVSPAVAEKPQDSLVLFGDAPWEGDTLAAIHLHHVTVGGKPADDRDVTATDWDTPCEWVMPTPSPGDYVVSLFVVSGEKLPGKFGYFFRAKKFVSDEFRQAGEKSGCLKAFRITAPPGQEQTRMFLSGDGISLVRADISPVTRMIENPDGVIRQLAESSYRTVLRSASEQENAPSCLILAPSEGAEARLARELADSLKLRLAVEPELSSPFPQYPASELAGADTNLILLSAGTGGPIVRAMRRAGLIAENFAAPGPGGYAIRIVPRPFSGKANVIVISGGDEAGLIKAVQAFRPAAEAATGDLVWDRFLVESPGERWAKLRLPFYRYADNDPFWERELAKLQQGTGGARGYAPGRSFIHQTADCGTDYWLTGNLRFADLFKRRIAKMQGDDIFGGDNGADSHMEIYGLVRAWERVEEAPVFTAADRLRITNYLLHRCIFGNEGFLRAYTGYRGYTGSVLMRHNHQTILGCGMMQSYLYFSRLYGLGCANIWKSWCDDLIENATLWGHGPENSFHYQLKVFTEVADMLHYQGLSAAARECSTTWPAAAARYMAARGSFGLPSCYGDCGDGADYETMDPGRWDFFGAVMRDDFAWPPAQFAIDQMIRGYRVADPSSGASAELFAYLTGSTDVGGILPPPSPAAQAAVRAMLGLHAIPMTEGYWLYRTGQVGNRKFWAEHDRPEIIPYKDTADKVVYRGGWGTGDEYMFLTTLGWCTHGHMELGAIVQYCQGGRLWIVENGYNNWGPEYCSTLEVRRDGTPAWGDFDGQNKRWAEFRTGPQMFEIIKLEQPNRSEQNPGAGPFHVVCRAKDLAGATWVRSVSGGENKGLSIEDTLDAREPGEYQMVFRLRLLGRVEGQNGKWQVFQKGAVLPIALEFQDGDTAVLAGWTPDSHGALEGTYPWYAFLENAASQAGDAVKGAPVTIEWKRTLRLAAGQTTVFRALVGPAQKADESSATPTPVIPITPIGGDAR